MEFQKNQIVTIYIEDIGETGEGIGRINGYTLFVKDAVIGDTAEVRLVKVKKSFAFARLEKIIKASPHRVEPPCPIHRQCGGCQIQAMSYDEQLRFKQRKVLNHLVRIGGFPEEQMKSLMEPIVGMEEPDGKAPGAEVETPESAAYEIRNARGFGYRNKAQFPVGTDKDGTLITGFYAGRTHQIIPNMDCLLGSSVNKPILETILNFMRREGITAYEEETGRGLVRHILIRIGRTTQEVMVCLIINGKKIKNEAALIDDLLHCLDDDFQMAHISLCINTENTNVIMGEEIRLLYGNPYIRDNIRGLEFHISPLSFYQVNPVQVEKLYGAALEFAALTGRETVWDLYCGIGTISLCLARDAKQVYGVEIIPQAIADAKENAVRNQITNAEFYVGKAEEVLPRYFEEEQQSGRIPHADLIVVDPPRKGCEAACLETMLKMQPARIIYISCDSATLARDLKYLCAGGYEIKRVRAVDMFGMTVHCEIIVELNRK
ncbi:MAG: 23S rRNA (uracil(1939)-C(5))-methyltransferase RlmD [Lachnospiraceae bacterium]